ncbi:ribosomal protein s14 [Echinococcus multilocularis]|uniref:Ribosomal protein s14 n=1 Tax=Echinococcus multilocularis TaxID=6211 RepID=A0A068Y3L4_ECHMU|nr:ribosomal protein s14 [Echinococcus multilocularis]
MSHEIERGNCHEFNASQDPECVFNATYSYTPLDRSRSSSILEGQIKIKRSPSYIFDLDDSFEHLDNAESLFGSVETTSMPNLRYLGADESRSPTVNPPRCMSAVPDFFHGSFDDVEALNYVNLSSFIKSQDEVYQSLLKKKPGDIEDNHSIDATSKVFSGSGPLTRTLMEFTENETDTKSAAHYSAVALTTHMVSQENKIGAFCQNNPCDIEMELLVLPMVNDFSKVEIRIPSASLSTEKKKALRRIAVENELTILSCGKGNSKCTVLRKKNALIQRQAAQREAEMEAERQRQRLIEEAKRVNDSQVTSESAICVASIQTVPSEIQPLPTETNRAVGRQNNNRQGKEIMSCTTEASMNSAARRKARRAAEREQAKKAAAELRKRERRRRETAMQTCPQDWIICPWCRQDIPPEEQCGHIGLCRAAYRQQNREAKAKAQLQNYRIAAENARRRKQNLPPLNPSLHVTSAQGQERELNHSRSASRRRSSHSRTRLADGNLAAALKRQAVIEAQLKEIHPNDVDGMICATQRVCALLNCAHIITSSAGGPCAYCRMILCAQHRSPNTGHHCPTAPKPRTKRALSNGQIEVGCGVEAAERQAALKKRMRDKLIVMAERRRR